MKLYYAPGACSLSPHIVLRELGLDFTLERVDTKAKTTASGASFLPISPMGYVPALELDDGSVLTEGAAIVQYLADANGAAHLAPANGTIARVRLQEQLNFLSSELHKGFTPLFRPDLDEAARAYAVANVERRLDRVEQILSDGRAYLFGDEFTVADAYLFVISNWTRPTRIALDRWPNLVKFRARVAARPAVQDALQAEGLQLAA